MDKVCGLDAQKDSVFACILDENGKKILEERFSTLTPDLDRLRDELAERCAGRVAMESTSNIPFLQTDQQTRPVMKMRLRQESSQRKVF